RDVHLVAGGRGSELVGERDQLIDDLGRRLAPPLPGYVDGPCSEPGRRVVVGEEAHLAAIVCSALKICQRAPNTGGAGRDRDVRGRQPSPEEHVVVRPLPRPPVRPIKCATAELAVRVPPILAPRERRRVGPEGVIAIYLTRLVSLGP